MSKEQESPTKASSSTVSSDSPSPPSSALSSALSNVSVLQPRASAQGIFAQRLVSVLAILVMFGLSISLFFWTMWDKYWEMTASTVDIMDVYFLSLVLSPFAVIVLASYVQSTGPNDDAVALALAPSKPSKSTSLMPGLWIPRWRFLSRFSPLFAPWSQGDVVLVAVLTVFTLVWWFAPVIARSTVDIGGHHEHSKTMLRLVFDRIAGWAGMAGMWDAGMAIVFVIRENHLMKSAVGNDAGQYHRGLKYHVGLGYASFLLISFHAVYFMIAYAIDNEFWSNMLPWLTPAGYWNALGFISWLALIAMIVSSIFKVRRSNYRIFYWTHQLYVVFLLFAFAHYFCGWYPLIGPLVYFVFDRILPRLKTKRNTSAVITRVSSTVARIDVPITAAYAGSSAYAPGDWLNILVPSVSAVNWHPFSIASYHPASPNHFTFFVKERGLWTKGVYDLASKDGTTVPVKIDGVFGSRSTEYLAHSHLVLVGGGTGIAALIPYMQHYARVTKGRITLVWIARTADEVLPYKTLLESLADSSRLGNRVEVLFHLTRETSQPAAKSSNIAATAGADSSSTLTDKGTNKPVAPSMPASNPDATAQPKSASFGVLASVLTLVVFGAGVAGYCFGRIYQPGYDMDRCMADDSPQLVGMEHFICWYYYSSAPTALSAIAAAAAGLVCTGIVSFMRSKPLANAADEMSAPDTAAFSMDEFRASFTWKTERPDFESILGLAFGDADTAKLASSSSGSSNGLSHTVAVMAAGPERMVRDVERLTIDARHVFLRESFKV